MRASIKGAARVIVAIGVVLWGTATYGQYSNRGSTKSLTSFCGFKRGEPKKNGAETTKARIPFRKFRNVRLSYSAKGRLRLVEAFAMMKGNADMLRKEIVTCCEELERQGVVFRGLNENDDGFDSLGFDQFSHAEVRINGVKRDGKKENPMSIYVSWGFVDEPVVDVNAALRSLKRNKDVKAFIESLTGEKFGSGVPENPSEHVSMQLKVTKNKYYAKVRVLSKPIWGMPGNVELGFGGEKGNRKLNVMSMTRRDKKVRKWTEIRADFDKLCKQVEATFGFKLDAPEEKESTMPFIGKEKEFSVTSQHVSSKFENDVLRITVGAMLDGKWPDEKERMPAIFSVKFEDMTLPAK